MSLIERLFGTGTEEQELQAEAHTGSDFEDFTRSNVGRYLIGMAEQKEMVALKELARADPDDKLNIIRLQAKAQMPGQLIDWIEQTISKGEEARYLLAQGDE
jgi:hypothetical protein